MKHLLSLFIVLLISHLVFSIPSSDNQAFTDKLDSFKQLVDSSPRQAITTANKLEKHLAKHHSSLMYGDFLLNKGLAYQRMGIQDSSLSCYQNAFTIAQENNIPSLLIRSHSNIAALSIQIELYKEAHQHLQYALNYIKNDPNERHFQGEIYTNIGLCYSKMQKDDSAFYYYNKAIQYYENIQDSSDLAVALDNLGQHYDEVGQKEEAIQYYLKAASVNKKNSNYDHLLNNYNNIGLYYKSINDYEKADEYFGMVDSIATKHSFNRSLAINYYNRANLYYQMNLYNEAIAFYQESIKLCERLGLTYGIIINKINYARWFAHNNNLTLAEQYWDEAEHLILKNNYNHLLSNLNEVKSDSYEKIGKFEEALNARNIQIFNEDSLKEQYQKDLMESLIKFYEVDRKNRIIGFQKEEIKEKNRMLLVTISGLLVFLVLSVILYLAWNHIRQKNRMLFTHIQRISKLEMKDIPETGMEENDDQKKQFKELFEKFNILLNREELFLDPNISRLKLAQKVSTNEKYLSQAIRENTSLSLSEYLNRIRTNRAMEVLSEMNDLKIESVILQSGFHSERTFFRVFKANTGLTPSQFYKLSKREKERMINEK